MRKDLAQIIRDNPGCKATIDNDCWWLSKRTPEPEEFDNWGYESQEQWHESQELATSGDDFTHECNTYQTGNCYGGDLLQVLANMVGVEIESV